MRKPVKRILQVLAVVVILLVVAVVVVVMQIDGVAKRAIEMRSPADKSMSTSLAEGACTVLRASLSR